MQLVMLEYAASSVSLSSRSIAIVHGTAAENCAARVELRTHTSPILSAMEWDKYEHGFCNSTIGILKT